MDSLTRQKQQQQHNTESRLHETTNTTNTSSRQSSSQQSSSSKHSRIMSVPQSPAFSDITVIENQNQKLNANTNGNYVKSPSFHSSPSSPPLSPPLSTQEAHRESVIKHMVNNSSSSTSNLNKTSNNTFFSNNAVYVSETDLYNVKNRLVPIPSAALLANSRYLPLFIRDRDVLRIGCHWSSSSSKNSSSPSSPSSSTVLPVYIHEADCLKIEHESICVYISEKDLQHVKDKFGVDFFKSTNTPQPQPYKTPTPSSKFTSSSWVRLFVFIFNLELKYFNH